MIAMDTNIKHLSRNIFYQVSSEYKKAQAMNDQYTLIIVQAESTWVNQFAVHSKKDSFLF